MHGEDEHMHTLADEADGHMSDLAIFVPVVFDDDGGRELESLRVLNQMKLSLRKILSDLVRVSIEDVRCVYGFIVPPINSICKQFLGVRKRFLTEAAE